MEATSDLAVGFLDLPDNVLEAILKCTSTKERAAAACTCHRIAGLSRRSGELWQKLSAVPRSKASLQALGRWVQARRMQVRRFQLYVPRKVADSPPTRAAALACLAMLAPQLVSLELDWESKKFNTAGMGLGAFTQLTYLCLRGAGGGSLQLSPDLGRLSCLEHLDLESSCEGPDEGDTHVSVPAGSIPPNLRAAVFGRDTWFKALPPALLAARSGLRRLEIHTCFNGRDKAWAFHPEMGGLPALGALTYLHLHWKILHHDCSTFTALPPELSALSSLRALELTQPALWMADKGLFAPLATLPALEALKVTDYSRAATKELPRLPLQLRHLDLRNCPLPGPYESLQLAPRLRRLSIHLCKLEYVAVHWEAAGLGGLQHLLLTGASQLAGRYKPGCCQEAARLAEALAGLAALPVLETLWLDRMVGAVREGGTAQLFLFDWNGPQVVEESGPALRAVQAARPALRLVQHCCYFMQERIVPAWDEPAPPPCPWCFHR